MFGSPPRGDLPESGEARLSCAGRVRNSRFAPSAVLDAPPLPVSLFVVPTARREPTPVNFPPISGRLTAIEAEDPYTLLSPPFMTPFQPCLGLSSQPTCRANANRHWRQDRIARDMPPVIHPTHIGSPIYLQVPSDRPTALSREYAPRSSLMTRT